MRRVPTRTGAVALVVAVGLALTGCGGGEAMTGEELFDRALEVNSTFKAAVGEVQLQVLDDEWVIDQYGDAPRGCGNGYDFRAVRATPEGWRIGSDPTTAAKKVGEWMGTNGWSDVAVKSFDGDIASAVITASRADAYVASITVDFNPGKLMDFVTIYAESTCEPGDFADLMAMLYPGFPTDTIDHEPLPDRERPDATPVFGFDEDGSLR